MAVTRYARCGNCYLLSTNTLCPYAWRISRSFSNFPISQISRCQSSPYLGLWAWFQAVLIWLSQRD